MSTLTAATSIELLQRLLFLSGRQNRQDAVFEALPHSSNLLGLSDLADTLKNLEIPIRSISCRENAITPAECPALILDQSGRCSVLQTVSDGMLVLQTGSKGPSEQAFVQRKASNDACVLLVVGKSDGATVVDDEKSISSAFGTHAGMMPWLLSATLVSNVLGLMAPLLIMAIYDRVIPSNSNTLLLALLIGALLVTIADFGFRQVRAGALAYVGAQSELSLTTRLFQKLMRLPLSQLTKADVGSQLARFRQFEGLRDIFTGHVMMALLDLPFAVIFFALLFYLAPPVGWMALGAVFAFVLLSLLTIPRQISLDQAAGEASQKLRVLQSDAIHNQSAVVNLGLTDLWMDRTTVASEHAERANAAASRMRNLSQSVAQSVMGLTSVMAIFLGTYAAIAGTMSFGGLIAVIALTGKVLAPFHALHSSMPQIISFLQSRKQADRVLELSEETQLGLRKSHQKSLTGEISFTGVTYRPDPLNAPVLSQASFKIEHGETVLLMGRDLSGRGAVLDLLDGLYEPLAGTIEHDGIDIRQIARDELRRSISFATSSGGLFHGTIEQNFRLAAPDLTTDDILQSLREFELEDTIAALPDGLQTRLNRATIATLSETEKKYLALVRSAARRANIYLFSEPTVGLDTPQREAFKAWLQKNSGKHTIVLASADQSLIEFAQRFIVIDQGRVIVNDKGDGGAKKLRAALKAARGSK